jgi:two-component system response regulator YesN
LLSFYEELAASAIRTFYELVPFPDIQPVVQRFKTMRAGLGLTLTGLEQQVADLCMDGAELVRKNSLSEGQAVIYKSLDYLKGQLHREVTVAECAAHVHLSASYFSSLFKKVTGMTLTQYVTGERIQKAKAMLVSGVPVQDVASAVGYEERRYFSDMFKKMTGMTPSEFRASLHPDGPDGAKQ